MASTYSTDLKLELMTTGEKSNLWGDITNTNLNILQQAVAGYQAVDITGGAQTTNLSFLNGSLSNGKNAVIELTGTITGNQIVTIPDSIEKTYIIKNSTSGAFTVQFKTVSGTGYTFSATDKATKIVYSNGTNIIDTGFVANAITEVVEDTSPQLGGDLDANGNNILIDDATGILDDSSNEQLIFQKTASAVNYIEVTNNATGENPKISSAGSDTDIGLTLEPKGTGNLVLDGLSFPNADGTTGQFLQTDGSGNLSFATVSSYTDSDALTLFNASGSAPVYACRAWVNFNGTGTPAIRDSGNVSSISDNGSGNYTINFATNMQDDDYAFSIMSVVGSSGFVGNQWVPSTAAITASSLQFFAGIRQESAGTVGFVDSPAVGVAIFR